MAGKFIFPGDAHDKCWEYAIKHHTDYIEDALFLLAPHHGRDSERDRSYLNIVKPEFSLLGSTPSKHLAYDAWRNRALKYHTQNQTGNMVIDIDGRVAKIYIENSSYASQAGGEISIKNDLDYYYLDII